MLIKCYQNAFISIISDDLVLFGMIWCITTKVARNALKLKIRACYSWYNC